MNGAAPAQRPIRSMRLSQIGPGGWALGLGLLAVLGMGGGCTLPPHVLSADDQHVIDRQYVEYPAGYELRRFATGLTAPTSVAFDADGTMYVASGVTGERGEEPRIWKFSPTGGQPTLFYPHDTGILPFELPLQLPFPRAGWHMYGPIGGMVVVNGTVIVTHHDENDLGVVTALDSKGGHKTLAAGFPAQGDYGLTDVAFNSLTKRVWFGLGTATNSGVVGLDNWAVSWVRNHPEVHDIPYHDVELLGYKFQTPNPMAGLFGPADIAVTAAYQSFNESFSTRVKGSPDEKPNGAIFSVSPDGGFAKVEAHGVHLPRGIAISDVGAVYIVIDGMEMRGTRPIKNDPDSLVRLPTGVPWLGWPDYTTDFHLVSEPNFQAPEWMVRLSGYEQVRATIDTHASGLTPPVRESMLEAAMPSLSGAAKLAFVPSGGAFGKDFPLSVIIALSGDRTPFATNGVALPRPVGFKVVRVDLDRHVTRDFVRNVGDLPGTKLDASNHSLIERPVDIKFGPDGAMYILDEGHMEMKHGHETFEPGTGQIFRLVPTATPTTHEK